MIQIRPSAFRLARLRLRFAASDFTRDTRGIVAVESIILLPILIWGYVAMFSFFDMLRMKSINQKAAFTIADAYSRESALITETYVDSTFSLFKELTRTNNPTIRVSVLTYDQTTDRYGVVWSKRRGSSSVTALNENTVNTIRTQLPVVASGDQFIFMETWNDYVIPFKIGMDNFKMKAQVIMNPRITGQLKFDDGSGGTS